MESSEGQLALIKVWSHGTGFEVDTTKSPKANFAGLAKTQGWVGGDANWRLHWEACFKEQYLFGLRGEHTSKRAVWVAMAGHVLTATRRAYYTCDTCH